MPTIPSTAELTTNSVDIFNAVRNSASANFRDYVPAGNPSQESIREIGNIIMRYNVLQNEFLSALVNRIALVMIQSKLYRNPWAVFKRGIVDLGETIEEIFVNLAQPYSYDPAVAESKVFKREIPDVRAAFHIMNYQKFYKETIQNNDLRKAFLSWSGISDLIAKIVEAMYTAANYDEFLTLKYLLGKNIINGRLYPVQIPAIESSNMKTIVSTIKGISNKFEYASTLYNPTGVTNHTLKEDQFVIVNADFDAMMDVEVLAAAFNMNKAEFMGHRVMIDGFAEFDWDRLDKLFSNDQNYRRFTSDEITALQGVPAVILDRDWFMVYDNLSEFTEQYNGEGLYWNYWYHVWKTFSSSPFVNAVVFAVGQPAVTGITITPNTVTTIPGSSLVLTATVDTSYFATKAVKWACETEGVSIDPYGLVTIGPEVEAGSVTITATSVANPGVSATATITVNSVAPTVTSVTVSPSSKAIAAGGTQQFTATVVGTNNPSQDVTWTITNAGGSGITVSATGLVSVAANATIASACTLTATSDEDDSVSGTATITIAE